MNDDRTTDCQHIGLIYSTAFELIDTEEICRKFIGTTPDEYLGIGYIALQRAKRNYNETLGIKFSTYATTVIKDQIIKAARKNSTLIKVAAAYRYQAWRVQNGKHQTQGNKKGVDAALRVLTGKVASLSLLVGVIGKDQQEANWIKEEHVARTIRKLDDRTRQVLIWRFGLNSGKAHTLEEIGQMMNPSLSRERVRQIEKEGLLKMRKMLECV